MTTRAENRHTKLKKGANVALDGAGIGVQVASRVSDVSALEVLGAAAAGTVATTGFGLVVGGAGLTIIGMGKNLTAAHKSQRHMEGLSEIAKKGASYADACTGDQVRHTVLLNDVLPYVIKQKKTKRNRRVVKAVPGVGLAESLRAIGRRLTKKDRGKFRMMAAECLAAHLIVGRCKLAEDITTELYDYESMVWIRDACEVEAGMEILADKMKST